eukprot:TRINITY_DN17134_c0_g2_i1.p1 TRINITY_DN17134_c0_g2~~TRINITY_DN17134_c0_g2_i1.p1  ORF type:complete len:628 (-),score=55.25 TRINITY_DN17134_c0_g2_i1:227-2110(-)
MVAICIIIIILQARIVASEQLYIVNAAPQTLDVKWLGDAEGKGTQVGQVKAGTLTTPELISMNTHTDHAFAVSHGEKRSKPFVYSGGAINLAFVGSADAVLDIEFYAERDLEKLAFRLFQRCNSAADETCIQKGAKSERLGIPIPGELMHKIFAEWDPSKFSPVIISDDIGSKGFADDGLLVVSSLSYPVELRWIFAGDDRATPSGDPRADSTLLWSLPGVDSAVSYIQVTARPQSSFLASQADGLMSESFIYPGEFALACLQESDGRVQAKVFDEDTLKIIVNDAARSCARKLDLSTQEVEYSSTSQQRLTECFASSVTLPQTMVTLSPALSLDIFDRLWTSWSHWRLCSYQEVTRPLKSVEFNVSTPGQEASILTVHVLRMNPLVIAIPAFATKDECDTVTRLAGTDLTRATVGGIGKTSTSRARRTLTRNLYPDLDDDTSTLTRLTTRSFAVARQATGYDLNPEGQEPVNWLFYKPGYEYRPHCDGACGTKEARDGGRVASSLLYCNVASDGGGTVFSIDKLKLEPSAGMFMLFAYKSDPQRLTQHAACPVLSGSKSTATQWYRESVSDEKPWDKFENWGTFTTPKAPCSFFESEDECPRRCEWKESSCKRAFKLFAYSKHPEL